MSGKLVPAQDGETEVTARGSLKRITDVEWDMSGVEPGESVELSAKLSGFSKPPDVTFEIFAASGREPVGSAIATVTADVAPTADLAKARWTVPDDLPPRLIFVAVAGSLRVPSPVIPAALPCIIDSEWVPDQALPGEEVSIETLVHKVPQGETVTFKIYWNRADKVVQHMEDVTATLDGEGKAVATWTIPSAKKLEEKDQDGTGAGRSQDGAPEADDDDDDDEPVETEDEDVAEILASKVYVFSCEVEVKDLCDPAERNILEVFHGPGSIWHEAALDLMTQEDQDSG
jgi:hypothetical protein